MAKKLISGTAAMAFKDADEFFENTPDENLTKYDKENKYRTLVQEEEQKELGRQVAEKNLKDIFEKSSEEAKSVTPQPNKLAGQQPAQKKPEPKKLNIPPEVIARHNKQLNDKIAETMKYAEEIERKAQMQRNNEGRGL